MKAWMYLIAPLEHWFKNYKASFDAWEEGGVRGIVVGGPLMFWDGEPTFELTYRRSGAVISTFRPDPRVYEKYEVDPPKNFRLDPAKERQLHTVLDDARRRGWNIMFFGTGHSGIRRSPGQDPFSARAFAAGVEDTLRAYPQSSGVIIDGAGENPYELGFHHGGELFELRPEQEPFYSGLGFDVTRMKRGMEHLRQRFHSLTPQMVRYEAPGGLLAGLSLFDINEDALYWLRARQETTLRQMAAIREQINRTTPRAKLGTIPRTATFAALTTQDYVRTHSFFDYIFPKLYFWQRGFDGMYGTIARWVNTLRQWNPGLNDADCLSVVKLWFGLKLPGIRTLADFDRGFPDEFFREVVFTEVRRALDATGDPSKVIAWVSSGRNPHAGDPMPAHDLERILIAARDAGLERFIYHPDPDLGAPEWKAISRMCGKEWVEDPNGAYWPSDTLKPDSWNGGRRSGR